MEGSQTALFFSTKEALKEAEGRKQGLEGEVQRVTREMQQKQEEINTLKEGLEEHCRAKEEISRYALNTFAVCVWFFFTFCILYS